MLAHTYSKLCRVKIVTRGRSQPGLV